MKISRSLPGVLIAAVLGLGLSAVATVSAVTAASAPPAPLAPPPAADPAAPSLRPLTNDIAERVQACTLCHGAQGRATTQGYFPRLAGKPSGYLYNQLQSFRDGRRHHALMAGLLRNMSDDYLHEIAGYFAALDVPYPAPGPSGLDAAQQARAERLILQGDPARKVPACTACHGPSMAGREPAIPGLLGLPRDYLVGQLGAWRSGLRRAHAPDCMADVAKALSIDDIAVVASWLAAKPAGAHPEPPSTTPLPIACGARAMSGTPTFPPSAPAESGAAPMRAFVRLLIGIAIAVPVMALLLLAGAWGRELWLSGRPVPSGAEGTNPALIARGAYLARIANCAGCHSPRGGAPLAGGMPLGTPFGTLFSSNLTPDPETGLGRWTSDDFWRAMHHGRSRDGRLLYPAFPYTSYTAMSREDADAIFAWLRQQPAVTQTAPGHQLGWPYRWQSALAVWRLMYFTPGDAPSHDEPGGGRLADQGGGAAQDVAGQAALARGRYLVQAVGHCAECHAPRNRLGALRDAAGLRGGWVGVQGWIAPSLADPHAAGVQDWSEADVRAWLRTGWSTQGSALGPMADVVAESLQHLTDADAQAMAVYLRGLPREGSTAAEFKPATSGQMDLGRQVYAKHCADCHGDQGQGRQIDGQPAYPPLAGNRTVRLDAPQNVLQMLADGGYAPTTPGHPRPYGMPPLRQVLTEAEMAAVATLIRQSWGNRASAVTEQEVLRLK